MYIKDKGKEKEKEKLGHAIIVSHKESFSVIGLIQKLAEYDIEATHAEPGTINIKMAGAKDDPIVYYVGDEVYSSRGARFGEELNKLVFDEGRLVIVVGEKAEYDKLCEVVPQSAIAHFFLRPIEIADLIDAITDCIKGYVRPKKRRSILIVDDDVTYMKMLKESLHDIYKITMMDTGVKAIRWLLNNRVDLILLDYKMPVPDGPQFFEMLKSDDDMKDIPIIFLTGVQDRDCVMKVMDLKPEDYILKSVDNKTLRAKLEAYFEKKAEEPVVLSEEDKELLPDINYIEALMKELNIQ